MHPLIKMYISSPVFLLSEWNKYLDKENLLDATILKLKDSTLNKYNSNVKLDEEEIDKALQQGHKDANFFCFFLSIVIICLAQQKQFDKAKSLYSIGNDLLLTKLEPAIHSFFLQACSRLKFYLGDLQEEKKLLTESLKLLKKENPRYQSVLTNYSYVLARDGMLNDLEVADKNLFISPSTSKERNILANEILVANSIVQGDFKKGFEYLERSLITLNYQKNLRYETAFFALKILSGDRNISYYINEEFKNITLAIKDFVELKWDVLPERLPTIKSIDFSLPFIYFITKYFPIHADLYSRNIGKAKLFLYELQKAGKAHFFDDFFYARIALLEGKKKEASVLFKRLTLNVRKYNFENRMAFELQFAKELAPSDLYYLLQQNDDAQEEVLSLEPNNITPVQTDEKGLNTIIGKSALINKVKKLIQKFSTISEPILVIGETGTGKELVAKALHDIGDNPKEPFLAINCGSLTDTLLESELFGYEAGAFTGAQKEKKGIFEAAGMGTVFLDEFEDVSPKMQSSLLRLLETSEIRPIGSTSSRKIHCKIVVATNIALKSLLKKKSFREDLYFRLARFEIKLPSLKDRKEDIPSLILHFLANQDEQQAFTQSINNELLEKLQLYDWPGNIRELKNVVERMKILHADKKILGVDEFEFDLLEGQIPFNVHEKKKNPLSNNHLMTLDNEDDARIKKIVDKGFKVESRAQYLKAVFEKYKRLSRRQVVEILNVSPQTAANTLQSLCDEAVIVKKTPTKSTKSHYYEWKE